MNMDVYAQVLEENAALLEQISEHAHVIECYELQKSSLYEQILHLQEANELMRGQQMAADRESAKEHVRDGNNVQKLEESNETISSRSLIENATVKANNEPILNNSTDSYMRIHSDGTYDVTADKGPNIDHEERSTDENLDTDDWFDADVSEINTPDDNDIILSDDISDLTQMNFDSDLDSDSN
jgi:hypothetical protein